MHILMQVLIDIVAYSILGGIGALVKKLFGRPRSETDISEMWIGTFVVVAVIVIVMMVAR